MLISRIERRCYPMMEVRVLDDNGTPKIAGHAAVFNQLSEDLGGFREMVDPGVFGDLSQLDVRSLYNHDENYVIARTKNGTLKLSTDDAGLAYEAVPPDTTWARDLLVTLGREDVDQSSFGFRTLRDKWETTPDGDIRTLLSVELWDVSPVTFPAYPQTDSQVRSALKEAGIDYDGLERLMLRHLRGLPFTDTDHDMIRTSIEVLKSYLPTDDRDRDSEARKRGFATLRRRLEIAEIELI